MDEEFDLLAGHDLGESASLTRKDEVIETPNILVWHKIESSGYQPSAREGHSATTNNGNVHIFGGFQTGTRTNSVLSLSVASGSWHIMNCTGETPAPRAYHAACSMDNYMIVHGGECQIANTTHIDSTIRSVVVDKATVQQSITKSMLFDSTANTSETAHASQVGENEAGTFAMEGVCPGDNMSYNRNANVNVVQGADVATKANNESSGRIMCMDDLYILDVNTKEWVKISCSLAPLPRKGHSMVVGNINSVPHVIIFGGYSHTNQTLSNSIHVCEVSTLIQHYKYHLVSSSSAVNKIKSVCQDNNSAAGKPVVFRTLNIRGVAPSPRYRHSCTVVGNDCGHDQLLVILGGIGKDPTVSLSDVHILNMHTLEWMPIVNGSDALAQGLAGDGPASGIYGHAAFAVLSEAAAKTAEFSSTDNNSWTNKELLVYGGSSNAMSVKSNCHHNIFGFSLLNHQWRRVATGFAFPSARNNHSATMVSGWAPTNDLPSQNASKGVALNGSSTHTNQQTSNSAVVIFGGVNSIMCASDTWALDLKWRPAGVEQYDNNATHHIEQEFAQQMTTNDSQQVFYDTSEFALRTRKIQSYNNEKYSNLAHSGQSMAMVNSRQNYINNSGNLIDNVLHISPSESVFGTKLLCNDKGDYEHEFGPAAQQLHDQQHITTSFDAFAASALPFNKMIHSSSVDVLNSTDKGGQEVGKAFLKVRKERAQADVQHKRERDRAVAAEAENSILLAQIETLKSMLEDERTRAEQEVAQLKDQLRRSIIREAALMELNEEAHRLILLGSIKNMQ